MSRYCSEADVNEQLAGGSLPNPGRIVLEVPPAAPSIWLDGHGFRPNAELVFRAEAGGSLPGPLVAGRTYYAIPTSDSTFQVAETPDGPPVTLTTAGSLVVVTRELPFDTAIEWASALVEDHLPAHVVPLTPDANGEYPISIRVATAELAAWKMRAYTGQDPRPYSEQITGTYKQLDAWARGRPIRGLGGDEQRSANTAIVSVVSGTDPRGWTPDHGGIP